jgi:hypothetical protein
LANEFRVKQEKYTAEINCVLTLGAIERTLFHNTQTPVPTG